MELSDHRTKGGPKVFAIPILTALNLTFNLYSLF